MSTSAKDMNGFLPLATGSILDNCVTDFDLYILAEGQYALFAPAPWRWTRDELTKLLASGQSSLFYHTRDQATVELWRRIQRIDVTRGAGIEAFRKKPPGQRIVEINDAAAELTRILYEQPLTAAAVAKGEAIAGEMIRAIKENPGSVAAIGKLARHDDYTYYHSARVAAYSLSIAVSMSLTDNERLRSIALGCLFHDVGKSRIALDVLHKPGALSPEEWDLMRKHPSFGIELVEAAPTPVFDQSAREIILHHHEKLDGRGYPHGISGQEIVKEVRIASFADMFDALTTARPYQVSRTRYEALDLIRHKLMPNVDPDVYKAVVELFGKGNAG
jgi:HD-GYP domain-containing protein (c-di-GMP phosphodiesterase class II)